MRSAVGLAVGMFAAVSLACSNASNPLADSKMERDVTVPPGAIPYITGVHVAALPAFDNAGVEPVAFNDLGEIVGDSVSNTTFGSTIFRWVADRGFTFLHLPVDSFTIAYAFSVNDRAQVAVQLTDLGGTGHAPHIEAGIWDWQGDVKVLRPLGAGYSCDPYSINDSGVVVGDCYVPISGEPQGSPFFATVWTAFGNPDGLYAGGGGQPFQGTATSISDAGYIAGTSSLNFTGFVFTPTKQLISLIPARASTPNRSNTGVNDSGWVAGSVFDSISLTWVPAVWTRGDSLHYLYRDQPGTMSDISDDGIAVGGIPDTTSGLNVPVIWTAANGLQRLPGLEGSALLAKESGVAVQINKVHQILGTIIMSTGQRRTVMWTLPDSPMLQARLMASMPRRQ